MRRNTLSPEQLDVLSYILTRREYAAITQRLQNLTRRVGIDLGLPIISPNQLAERDDDKSTAAVSRNAIKLFSMVYSLAAVYDVLVGLIRQRGKQLPQVVRAAFLSLSSLRLASFISAYSAMYRLVLPRLHAILPQLAPDSRILSSSKLPPFLAALFASPAMLLEPSGQRRVTLALYALTRAAHVSLGAVEEKIWGSPLPLSEGPEGTRKKERKWYWGGHLVFAAANAVLLHAFVYYPSTFPAAYSNFILRYSSAYLPARPADLPASLPWPAPREVVDAVASLSHKNYPAYISPLLQLDKSAAIESAWSQDTTMAKVLPVLQNLTHPAHKKVVCGVLHPETVECRDVFTSFVAKEFKGASKFFGALALLSALIRYKKTLKRPDSALLSAVTSTITSSAFLSLSLGTAWSTICLFQHQLPNRFMPTRRWHIQGFLAGLWVYLVPAQRATDLGIYSARMAIQTAWEVGVKENKWRSRRNGEILYFAAAMGVLMSAYETRPDALKSGLVRAALARIGGEKAKDEIELREKLEQVEKKVQEKIHK